MSKLKPLPEAVRSSVRSGIILYNLTKVVEELVFNSLDAGATKVSIAVGVGTCFVKVADNGSGVDRDGLVLLGERYATSKHNLLADLDTNYGSFGFHGEALCSIADVSLLEIITKAHGRPHGYRKVMKGTKCLFLGINNDRHDMGTTVVVRDLFYNQPVRRKHMQSSPKKVLHSVKKCVLRIALVHSRVSFRVVDVESEEELLSTCSSPSPLTLLSSNFGIEAASSLNDIKVSEGELKLYGYLSGPFGILSLKAFQYIYINSRFVCKGPIHKLLNHLAAGYWDDKEINIGAQNEKRSTSQICPTFILNLSCPRSHYDITFEPLKNSVEFVDWSPVLVFVQNTVSHFWSEKISDVNRESGKKRCRTHKWQVSAEVTSSKSQKLIEDHNKLLAWRGGLSSCQKSNGNASELKKNQTDALFIHDNDCAVQSCDASLFHSGGETNKKIPSPMQLSGNSFYDEENRLVVELSTKDTGNKEVEYFLDSEWQDKSFEMEDSMNMSIRSPLYSHCHEFSYAVDCNHVFREPSQLNCFIERSLEYVKPSFASKVGIEFRSDDFSMQQQKWVDLGEGVDAGEQDDIDQIFNERLSRKGEVKSLWSFSRCTNQRVKRTNSNVFSQDLRSSLIAGESSDEEGNYLLSNSLQHIEQSGCNRSSTSEGPLAPNSLFTTDIPSVDHFIGQDVIFDGRGTRCDYFPDREGEYCNFNLDTAVNSWDLENSTDFSSDSKFYADFQEDVSEVTGHKLKDSRFPNCSSMFLDDMDWLHIHSCGENNLPNSSDYSNYYSLPEQSDRIKRGRIEVRNDKTMLHHNGPRRSHSAPPFYKRRRKYFALNNFLRVENGRTKSPVINSDSSLPETGNLQHPQRLFGQCHFASKASYVDESLLLPRLDNKGFQKKGQCINNCMLNPVEDPTSKEIPDVSDSGLKWRDSCKETAGALKSHHDTILDVSSGILHLVGDSLVPSSIDKNYLKDAKVLQQVDKKFIPVVGGRLLAIIDQHAADERIRLEELRQKVLSGEMKQVNYLEAEQELVLPEIGYQLLHSYVEQVQSWGWICNIYCPGSRSFGKNLNVLHRQPTVAKLVAVPCILGVNLTDIDLLEFLQQLADTDGSSTIPPSVHRVLNNKACRGAIMFGDTLLPSECSLIVEELKQTSLCFQCAHGRPTTVPLVNLDVLHKQIDKLALCRSGAHELWQGLCRHEISLERAACRLSSAID